MIQQQTVLKVSDNSGAKTAKCIKVLGGFKRKIAHVGDVIVVSIKELRDNAAVNSKVKKGDIHRAIIIRTKQKINNNNHILTFFDDNAIVLINKQNNPIATRIVGPISKKIKNKNLKLSGVSGGFV